MSVRVRVRELSRVIQRITDFQFAKSLVPAKPLVQRMLVDAEIAGDEQGSREILGLAVTELFTRVLIEWTA